MKPNRKIDTQDVGALIRQLEAQKITQERFSVDMPVKDLANGLYAAYKAEVKMRGHSLQFDEATDMHIRAAAEWLANPKGKCGLMLQGLYGNGKTTLMMAICNLVNYLYDSGSSANKRYVKFIEAQEIARIGSRDESRNAYLSLYNEDLLAIDDLGEEPSEIISYGRVYTPVKDLLLERYKRQKFTILSTNLINTKSEPQIADRYGERMVDRIREMMQIIVFKNSSYRKQ